jgi:transcriptional regulator with XRE-family HTH domain
MEKHPYLIVFGQRLRFLRKIKKISQENFANSIDMNRGYYGTIERGEANPAILNVLKIAKGLNMPLSELFPPE